MQQMHEGCEQRDRAEGQLQAMRQQQAEQAPQVAALVSERQQWMLQLQSERTHASRAIDDAEVTPLRPQNWHSRLDPQRLDYYASV